MGSMIDQQSVICKSRLTIVGFVHDNNLFTSCIKIIDIHSVVSLNDISYLMYQILFTSYFSVVIKFQNNIQYVIDI